MNNLSNYINQYFSKMCNYIRRRAFYTKTSNSYSNYFIIVKIKNVESKCQRYGQMVE